MTDTLRICGVIIASSAVILLMLTVLGTLGDRLERQTWIKGVAMIPVLVAVDAGFWVGLNHHLPLNQALYLMLPALVLFDFVFAYYLIRDLRSHP
jgi:hypothetical protein